jgi:hypothetical protein
MLPIPMNLLLDSSIPLDSSLKGKGNHLLLTFRETKGKRMGKDSFDR